MSDVEAWWFNDGKWSRINAAEAGLNAYVIRKTTYAKRFGRLPHLPNTALPDQVL